MSTSGVSTWSLTRDSIINSALRKVGVIAEGQTANSSQLATGTEALNALLKTLATKGMPIWAIKSYTFTTTLNTATYNIGVGQTLNTSHPLKVIQAYRVESSGAMNVPLQVTNLYDFNLLPISNTSGEPVSLYYHPLTTYGVVSLWPKPSDNNTTITVFYQSSTDDMVSATDNLDFPSYWTEAVIYTLAWRLAPEYGTSKEDRGSLATEAKMLTEEALSFGTEEGSLYLMPDWTGRRT